MWACGHWIVEGLACLSKELGFYSGIKWNEEPLNDLEEECDKQGMED